MGAATGVALVAAVCASGPERAAAVRTAVDVRPLPADRYRSTAADDRRSQQATALLVRQCMAGRGHPGFPLDPQMPGTSVGVTAVATDYGVLDPAAARRWGYGWDPAKAAADRPKGRRVTGDEFTDWASCTRQASARLLRGVDVQGGLVSPANRAVEIGKQAKADPRLRAAWDAWSRCMAAEGFPGYPDPVAAYSDPAWSRGSDGNTAHTPRERATAAADVACKLRHHTVEVWQTVQAQEQAADIAAHPASYAAALKALRTSRANVAEVLRTLG